jgi:hypothetical protein
MAKCSECGEKKNPAEAKFCSKCGSSLAAIPDTDKASKKKKAKSVTTFEAQTEILADLWLNYKQDEEFADFIEYNDIGLPLAYVISNQIVKPTEQAKNFINETFELLLAGFDIDEDEGFETLDEILEYSQNN